MSRVRADSWMQQHMFSVLMKYQGLPASEDTNKEILNDVYETIAEFSGVEDIRDHVDARMEKINGKHTVCLSAKTKLGRAITDLIVQQPKQTVH